MKWNNKLSLTLVASFAIILPASAFEDQNQDGKKHDKKEGKGRGHEVQASQQGESRVQVQSGGKSHGRDKHNESRVSGAAGVSMRQSNVSVESSQSVAPSKHQRSQRNQTQAYSNQQTYQRSSGPGVSVSSGRYQSTRGNQVQVSSNQRSYTKSNNYGGLWYPENSHSDWNRDGRHYYNHHNYRWYDGGWIIIDGGYTPSYSTRVYSTGGSVASNVQARLADKGYYRGPIDGDIGPGTRNAIANYQGDHDLRVTGRINDSLLESLRLE